MRGAGGRPGGAGLFLFGLVLAVGGLWLFFDSVRATTAPFGLVSGWMGGFGGAWETTSQAIVFVPFLLGVGLLGLALLWITPSIARRTTLFRTIWLCALLGGIGRLVSWAVVGTPPVPMIVFTLIEVPLVPVLLVWQTAVSRRSTSE